MNTIHQFGDSYGYYLYDNLHGHKIENFIEIISNQNKDIIIDIGDMDFNIKLKKQIKQKLL